VVRSHWLASSGWLSLPTLIVLFESCSACQHAVLWLFKPNFDQSKKAAAIPYTLNPTRLGLWQWGAVI
jgi:hypothetical protein